MIDLDIGKGPLWQCVTSGRDPHILGATKTLGKDYEDITKEERQGQKVVAFGVPGGLGPKSLKDYALATFGVRWTLAEAKKARSQFLTGFPDVEEYLDRFKEPQDKVLRFHTNQGYHDWKDQLECGWNVISSLCHRDEPELVEIGEKCARHVPGRLRTGLVRSNARFTEIANTCFQGLAAAVTKHAEWLLFRAMREPPVIVCHDEVVMEFDPSYMQPRDAKSFVKKQMLQAFIDICPDVGPYAKAEAEGPVYKWGKDTDKDGNEI
jgi:DNA polymerase I-like protein with 3'-5' exonuclease and polymerase domains